MLKVAHIADIHIRGNQRHLEYKKIFEKFSESVRQQDVDIIFIAGDIFHTKTSGLTPEYIDFMRWWFTDMASIAPVHVILGNHDGNLANLSRQDAVTPILEALGNDNIFLYKKSGTYTLKPGYELSVFSIFDEEGWAAVKQNRSNDAITVACYHGPIKNARLDEGWTLDSEITTDFFKDYDFCLLGDIHLKQDLEHRKCIDGVIRPWMSYPGSMVQQNYGECIENHGYLLWEIENRENFDVHFYKLHNDHPYVTIEYDKLESEVGKYPRTSRFRIKSPKFVTQKDINSISANLLSKGALEVIFKSEFHEQLQSVLEKRNLIYNDIHNIDNILQYMKDYAARVMYSDVSEEDWVTLRASVENLVQKRVGVSNTNESSGQHRQWTLGNMQWNNMFSYGENNKLDFSTLNGIVGIVGPNRSGKSSIVGILLYALFNSSDRGIVKNLAIINDRKQDCNVSLDLQASNGKYTVKRQTVKRENKAGEINGVTSLDLVLKSNDGTESDMNGEQRTDTEKTIRKIAGTFEDFSLTGVARQGSHNQFIDEGSAQRKVVLTKFLDLDFFEKLHDVAKADMQNLKYVAKDYEKDFDKKIGETKDFLDAVEKKIDEHEQVAEELSHDLDKLKVEYQLLAGDQKHVTLDEINHAKKKVEKLKNELSNKRSEIKSIEHELSELNDKKSKIENLLSENSLTEMRKSYHEQIKLESEIAKMKLEYQHELEIFERKKRSSLKLLDVPCGDDFPSCKYIKDLHYDRSTLDEQKSKMQNVLRVLEATKDNLSRNFLVDLKDKIEKLEKLASAEVKLSTTIASKISTIAMVEKDISILDSKCIEQCLLLDELTSKFEKSYDDQHKLLHEKIDTLKSQKNGLDKTIKQLYFERGKYEHELQKLIKNKEASLELLSSIRIYEFIVQAFSKKGIPATILHDQLPIINAEIAKVLSGIVDFTVEFKFDDDYNSLDIFIDYGHSRRLIELCSGMEKTIAAIAIRVALWNVTLLPKPDFLILDEGFGTLDPNQVESCGRLLQSLKKYFRFVIIITHVDTLKDYVDKTIEISMLDKSSHVYV